MRALRGNSKLVWFEMKRYQPEDLWYLTFIRLKIVNNKITKPVIKI